MVTVLIQVSAMVASWHQTGTRCSLVAEDRSGTLSSNPALVAAKQSVVENKIMAHVDVHFENVSLVEFMYP